MKNLYPLVLFIFCLTTGAMEAAIVVGGVAGSLTVKNSIIYNDTTYLQIATTLNITNSAVRGSTVPTGNFSLSSSAYSKLKDSMAVAPVDTFSYYLSPTSTLRNAGTNNVTLPSTGKDINGNDRLYDLTIDIGAVEYSEVYQGASATWETAADWNIGRFPHNKDIVSTRSACQVTSTTTPAVCKKLIIESPGSLTIKPNTQLIVSDSIRNKDATKLIVKTATDNTTPNGTLIFHNSTGNPPYATVEMYTTAIHNTTGVTYNQKTYYNSWQYFGVPLRSVVASPTFDGSYVRSYHEDSIRTNGKWANLVNSSVLTPFTGYEITQNTSSPTTIIFQGALYNRDSTISLMYHSNAYDPGQNIFSNPYTAAINIKNLTFGKTNPDSTVYLYNTGSLGSWGQKTGESTYSFSTTTPGQYIAIPKNSAGTGGIPSDIPSMSGFLVKANSASPVCSITIKYNSVITQNLHAQRAPSLDKQTSDRVYMEISLKSEHSGDCMWLINQPGTTHGFDNGWDGYKLVGDDGTPQLFAMEESGNYQVSTSDDMSNTYLGFQPGDDTEYSLLFKNENIGNDYSNVYLLDLAENKTVDITPDSSIYSFTAEASGKLTKRFKIVTIPEVKDTLNITKDINLFSSERTIFVNNLSNLNGNLAIYDISGRLVQTIQFGANCISPIQTSFPTGVYIVKATTKALGVTNRLILQ
jgi:hypothetical protein